MAPQMGDHAASESSRVYPLRQHLEAIAADMAEAGVTPDKMNVLRHALEVGVPEPIAVQLVEMIEDTTAA